MEHLCFPAAEEEDWKNSVRMNLDEHEVNLRERVFLGGIITMEIFHQPPQPKYLRYKHDVTLCTYTLQSIRFWSTEWVGGFSDGVVLSPAGRVPGEDVCEYVGRPQG